MSFRDFVHFWIYQSTRYLSPMPVAVEWVLVILGVLFVAFAPLGRLDQIRTVFQRLAQHRTLAIAICGILPIVLRISLLGIMPVPDPSIHDEFGHLLLGDTLAHGRLTNQPHPLWQHFESIHVIQQPTYASMYLPGQGSFLALGQVVFHDPWAGVAISVGIMFAALCWMMQGWLTPAWALYGTLIALLKIGVTGPWMNSYLGGPVPAIGGALLMGLIPRIRRFEFHPWTGILLGAACVILLNTRPYEGGILALVVLIYAGRELLAMSAGQRSEFLRRIAAPAAVVATCGVAFTGFYCWRVTGSPVRMPYQVNRDTYGWPENLAFLSPKHLVLRHQVLQEFNQRSIHNRDAYTSWDRVVDNLNNRVFDNWIFYVGPALTLPLLFLVWVYRNERTRMLVVVLSIMLVVNLFQLVLFPYHFAPLVPILFTIVAAGIWHLHTTLRRTHPRRAANFLLVLPVLVVAVATMKGSAEALQIPMTYWETATEGHRDARASLQRWLTNRPGKQLVIVRYASNHNSDQEWVYNSADINGSKVVWAREMNPKADSDLLRYFADRQAWLLEADVSPQRVVHYSLATCAQE